MPEPIDLFVGTYGFTDNMESQVVSFLSSLRNNCDLNCVNVFCVERECRPVSDQLKHSIRQLGFNVLSCPLPRASNCHDDTALFADWMVNSGSGAWAIVSHYDVAFGGNYVGYVRGVADDVGMVGNHHDGIVSVRRKAYQQCQVGFCRLDSFCRAISDPTHIVPSDSPDSVGGSYMLSLDVGELLALRMNTLGWKHVWFNDGGMGKTSLFIHTRCGSGHELPR